MPGLRVWLEFSVLGVKNIQCLLAEWACWNPCSSVIAHVSIDGVVNIAA